MKKNKDKIILFLLLIIVAIIPILAVRYNTEHVPKDLDCNKETENSKEKLLFRFDAYGSLYAYDKDLKLYNLDEASMNEQYTKYSNEQNYFMKYNNKQEEDKGIPSEYIKYNVNKGDTTLEVKVYIFLRIYGALYDYYIKDDHLKYESKMNDVKEYLESNGYSCEIKKK